MKFGLLLRGVGLLRRIAKALEKANELKREEIDRALPQPRNVAKLSFIDTPKIEDWNAEYQKELSGE